MLLRAPLIALITGLFVLSGGLVGQDPKKDKEDPKANKPADPKKDEPKKDEPKVKGQLPQHWGKIGLEDKQKQEIYKIQGKYNDKIDKLEAEIKELKASRDKDMKGVLTPDQKKRLDDILTGKDK